LAAGAAPSEVPVLVFDSAPQAVAALVAGRADVVVVSAASVVPAVEAGGIRVVATTGPDRMPPPLDEVPTWREVGIDCLAGTWRGLVAPPGLDRGLVRDWDEAIAASVEDPRWAGALAEHLWISTPMSSTACGEFLDHERDRLRVALAGLELVDG
jgi:putative tricarboxylic transport membrane protein